MSRPVIPPLPPSSIQDQSFEKTEVLRRRLAAAEEDARQMLSQLGQSRHSQGAALSSDFGQSSTSEGREKRVTFEKTLADKLPHPREEQMVEPMLSSSSQDALISRVCKLESMLQTLKLGLASSGAGGSGGIDKKRLKVEVEERVSELKQEFGAEIVRLKRQLASLQEELGMEVEAKARLKEEAEKLKEALEEVMQAKAEAAVAVDDLSSTKQKLIGRISELKEEVARESSLRSTLEVSHTTLMSRVQEMETLVDRERQEVQNASANTNSVRQEAVRLKEELSAELSRRQMAEEACQRLIAEKEKAQTSLQAAQSDCNLASGELSRLQNQYSELIRQLEQTQRVIDQQNTHMQEVEADRTRLHQIAERASTDQQQAQVLQARLKEVEDNHRLIKQNLEEEIRTLRTTVTDLDTQNASLVNKMRQLQADLEASQNALACRERDFNSAATGLESELNNVRKQLQSLEIEKESVLKGKESLLEEVNQTVDSLMSERTRLQGELEQVRAEADRLRGKWRQTESENMQLMERIGSFEQQQTTHRKVESTLKEMVEQKNKLAYDNGKLQSQVTQLKQDLTAAQTTCSDNTQLRKVNEMVQGKLVQLQKEAGDFKVVVQKLEGKLRHTTDLLEQKQHELQLTQARREELEREVGQILGRVEVLESREKNKTQQHQKNMEDAKSVNREISHTLEAVMSSHTQLQELVENLQAELGRRDTEIGRLKNLRQKDQDGSHLEKQRMEETVEALRAELKKEQDKSGRKANRDIAELKKQNSNLSTRNGELVATNTELRQRVGEMERTVGELQQKLAGQRHKVDHMHRARKQVEDNLQRMKQMREDIDELEKMRDEYMQKNQEQAETIGMFMQQMSSLQEEVQQLAAAHLNTGRLLKMKEEALEKERRLREELKRKYSETKKREDQTSKQKHTADERLKEAHNESVEIQRNLMEAHEWFKGKFEKLQDELMESRAAQAKLEQVNTSQRHQLQSEKSRAQEAAERAKEMIKASRHTLSKLADYTEQADVDTKQQLAQLRAEVEKEKAHSKYVQGKYHHLKDAVVKASTSSAKRNSHR
ncbi:uncharacterized protein LOC143287500 isoform X2 [Babylonia areolata]|uniref:uncharacterized protein LOC143287500 isoform X2 n=1 Tax=Babylonia areolata TaxID=304850 RepID=UPI003FD2EC9F